MPLSVPATVGSGDFKADGTVALTGQVTTNVGTFASAVANGASAVGFNYNTPAYSTAGALLARWQNNGVTKATINKDGKLTATGAGGTVALSPPDGNGTTYLLAPHTTLRVLNAAGSAWMSMSVLSLGISDTGFLNFGALGGETANAAISLNASGVLEVNNRTAGTFRDLKLRSLLAGGGNGSYVQTPSMTVANLASAATAGAGARAFVTDATATTFLTTVSGGGANKVPVVSDGTNWLIG